MSTINQLTEASAVSSSMQVPVYDTGNGQPRKISINQLQEFLQENLEFGPDGEPLQLASLTVAEIAADYPASAWSGAVLYCSNGDGGSPCLAVSNGTDWKRIALGSTISA